MADVFISYASEDRNRIKPLAEALEANGFSVWWDRALGAGEDYASVIARELAAAKAVIVVWTDASAASTFVRDEASHARDQGRLVPVLLDRVQIPLGFGSYQAEDFTRWNGGHNAPQMQLLREALRAKLEGRAVDGGLIQARRRRLMTRIRIVSVLGVVAAIAVIAFVGNSFINPPEPPAPISAQERLLDLLNQGKLTPEQAIELARLLEAGALGETQEAALRGEEGEAPASARSMAPGSEASLVAEVTSSEFDTAARETFRQSMATLLTAQDPTVRTAALSLSSDERRGAAIASLLSYAEANPAQSADIYRVVGAVGEANGDPRAQQALEEARNVNPQDAQVWRMLSYSYRRANRSREAEGAALVGAGLSAQAQGQTEVAEQRLEAALPNVEAPEGRAFVEGALGDAAAARNDWGRASQRYGAALDLRERAAPDTPAAAALQVDAQKLVRALDRDGRTNEACRQALAVQREHEVAPADEDLVRRCEAYRIQLRPRVQTPSQRSSVQTAPAQRQQLQVQPRTYEAQPEQTTLAP